jgi:hypothetical protein
MIVGAWFVGFIVTFTVTMGIGVGSVLLYEKLRKRK